MAARFLPPEGSNGGTSALRSLNYKHRLTLAERSVVAARFGHLPVSARY